MYFVLSKFIAIISGFTLVIILGEQVVEAQLSPNASPTEEVQPRSLPNYIGIAGNIGVSGDSKGLGQGGVAIFRKSDLSDSLSIRGITVFGESQTDTTLALTVNFPVKTSSGQVQLVPFIGGGMLMRLKSGFEDISVRGLVTSGIDVPLSRRLTATTSVNVGFTDKTDVGVQFGVAYNF
jgi:hypothetical protein